MYRARVVEHSISDRMIPLVSMEIEYPRKVLAEVATHRKLYDTSEGYEEIAWTERQATRDLSKNSASSRAIPFAKMLKKVMEDPYVPDKFSIAGPGMQAAGYMEGMEHEEAVARWLGARDQAVDCAMSLLSDQDQNKVREALPSVNNYGGARSVSMFRSVHKQDINRLLEPWAWITQIVTGDGIGMPNFFALRCHKDADPAFQKVARMAYLALRKSTPKQLEPGQWHLPYVKAEEKEGFVWHATSQIATDKFPDPLVRSIARCAWISYQNQDREADMAACRGTFAKLMGGDIKHASPCEHQGSPMTPHQELVMRWTRSNLTGWLQARKLIVGECIKDVVFSEDEIRSWGINEDAFSVT